MSKHIFHLVLNKALKNNIIKFSNKLRLSISKSVIYILELSLPVIEKYQLSLIESECLSKYNKINWDSHIHINFDENLFRKIKHLSDTISSFSTAIVIRKLLCLYFTKIKKYKKHKYNDVLSRYKNIYIAGFKKRNSATIQLFNKIYYQLSYNINYKLIGINFYQSD